MFAALIYKHIAMKSQFVVLIKHLKVFTIFSTAYTNKVCLYSPYTLKTTRTPTGYQMTSSQTLGWQRHQLCMLLQIECPPTCIFRIQLHIYVHTYVYVSNFLKQSVYIGRQTLYLNWFEYSFYLLMQTGCFQSYTTLSFTYGFALQCTNFLLTKQIILYLMLKKSLLWYYRCYIRRYSMCICTTNNWHEATQYNIMCSQLPLVGTQLCNCLTKLEIDRTSAAASSFNSSSLDKSTLSGGIDV